MQGIPSALQWCSQRCCKSRPGKGGVYQWNPPTFCWAFLRENYRPPLVEQKTFWLLFFRLRPFETVIFSILVIVILMKRVIQQQSVLFILLMEENLHHFICTNHHDLHLWAHPLSKNHWSKRFHSNIYTFYHTPAHNITAGTPAPLHLPRAGCHSWQPIQWHRESWWINNKYPP